MDDFDFDDIDDAKNKKPVNKNNQKQPASKANKNSSKNDDFFDFQMNQKPKNTQPTKKINFEYNNLDSYLDDIEKKQSPKKVSQRNKQNESSLPRISISKSPQNKPVRSKMDLTLEELPQKRVMVQKDQKKVKKQSQEFDYAVYGGANEPKQDKPKTELKTNIVIQKEVKQQKKPIEIKSSPKNISKTVQVLPNKNKSPEKPKVQRKKHQEISQDEYAEEYQQEIEQSQKKPQQITKKIPQQKPSKHVQQKPKPQPPKKQPIKEAPKKESVKQSVQKQSKPQTRSKVQQKQAPINRYKEMVQKSFPQDLDQQKAKKMKPDALNRVNDKMRDMIKGFSAELTDLIDKNLLLLRKPQNQIKEEIQGQPIDPLQAQIKLLEQSKKNNQKMLEISQKQLQNTIKMNQKMEQSVATNVQVTEQLEAFRKHIALITREISNLKNDIQKEGKKVVKMEENNTSDEPGGKFKNSLEISQKLANAKLQYQKHKKKLQELNEKQRSLQQKINQTSSKKNQALEKASAEGINFCSKQQKKRYEQLKKKHDQLVLFQSKFKSSIKSKQSLIQHEMTDLQVLIEDYQKKYEVLNDEAYVSKQKIFAQIAKAKKNPKINSNTKEILAQLQIFMSDDTSNQSQQQFSSLNYISQNIYKKEYQSKNNSKQPPSQKQLKKAAYKNYIQEVAKINEQQKAKITSQRRNSQVNPFRKALTPGETSQAKQNREKMNKTKDNKVEADKQRQRVWKSSNTQTLIRNPLKKQVNKQRYANPVEQENPLNNKQIMKLIDKNKEKIVLKEEQKIAQKTQQSLGPNKKPFTFRASLKEKQLSENANPLAHIPNQMQQIQKTIEIRRNEIMNRQKQPQDQTIPVKLKDKEQQGLQLTLQQKPAANNTPFRNIKLKKDKDKQTSIIQSDAKFNLQTEKPMQKVPQKTLSIPQNLPPPQIQQQTSFKPKRFNLRQKKQNPDNAGYMPSSVNAQKSIVKQPQIQVEKAKEKELEPQFKIQQNKFRISDPAKKKQQEPFDPFKKFMANPTTDDKPFSLANDNKNEGIKLSANDDPPVINTKPRMNLFKKQQAQTQQPQKKQIVLKDVKKQQAPAVEESKFVNPYAKEERSKQQGIKVQRQGRIKKMNPASNALKGGNKNIFGDVEDATSNNILSLGQPQIKPQQQSYVPKTINQQKELNVNDLLGIKKKNVDIDKDLLIDLPNNNKVSVKAKAGGKAGDFFGDMDL